MPDRETAPLSIPDPQGLALCSRCGSDLATVGPLDVKGDQRQTGPGSKRGDRASGARPARTLCDTCHTRELSEVLAAIVRRGLEAKLKGAKG